MTDDIVLGDRIYRRQPDGTWLAWDRTGRRSGGDAHETSPMAAALDEIERLREIETWADGARIQLAEAYDEIERLQVEMDTAEVLVEHKDAEIERLREIIDR